MVTFLLITGVLTLIVAAQFAGWLSKRSESRKHREFINSIGVLREQAERQRQAGPSWWDRWKP